MIKLSDFVMDYLAEKGITDIFTVSGGGIMHLLDSLGRHRGIRHYCNYHEQASAIAAEGYARTMNSVGVCLVTTGPGSTNALSGVVGAWVDSIPVLVISGQVRRDLIADYSSLRQLGPQEINIVDMARPVTKYVSTVTDPRSIRDELDRALATATSGRPGPVWINIPLDVQGAMIEQPEPSRHEPPMCFPPPEAALDTQVGEALRMLRSARRPVLICGNGVHLAGAEGLLLKAVERLRIPVLLTIGAMDLLEETNEYYMGRFGPVGQRRANFVLQNSDFVMSIGASMCVASIGYNTSGFAPRATRVMVNIDEAELDKKTYIPDLRIRADASHFLRELLRQAEGLNLNMSPRWLPACGMWKDRYPVIGSECYQDQNHVNSYVFTNELSQMLTADDVVVTGNSLDAWSAYQAFMVKAGQRLFTNVNYGAMGWDLPALVGASVARRNRRTILITGDGSIQFNIHELMTIGHNRLNVRIFLFNNGGYQTVRATQDNFFSGRYVGADASSGVANPDFELLARAYGLKYVCIQNNDLIRREVGKVLDGDGPVLCELNLSYHQGRSPRAGSYQKADGTLESRPLEDMSPFLPRDEVFGNMHMFDGDD